jgi:hypothetical protein
LPSSGPVEYEICSIPASRPRSRSGIVWFQITLRKIPLTMSHAPATANATTASHRFGASPNAAIAIPHPVAARQTAAPWRATRDVHPDVSVASNEPIDGAA